MPRPVKLQVMLKPQGLANPGEPTTGRLTRRYDVLPALGVQDQRRVATAILSTALVSAEAIVSVWGGRDAL